MDFKITNHQITKLNIDFNQAKNTNEMADMLLSFNIRVPEDKDDHQYKIIIKVSFKPFECLYLYINRNSTHLIFVG